MAGKYSVIFLSDGGATRRWRMGPALLRPLFFLLVLIPLVAAGSLWLNWHLWQDLRIVREENDTLRREVESHAQTTARLANLEQFLSKTDPRGLEELVTARPADTPARPEPSAEPTLAPAVTDSTEKGTAGPTEPDPAIAAPSPADVPPVSDAASADTSLNSSPTAVPPPQPVSEEMVDKGLARVENLTARRVGARSLRVSFDLYNTEQVPQLAGKASFEIILADGSTYPLDDHGDTSYRINRLKKIVGNPLLPAEVTDTRDAVIRISVFADDALIYRVTTPLRQ